MAPSDHPRLKRKTTDGSTVPTTSARVSFSSNVSEEFRRLESTLGASPHMSDSTRSMLRDLASGRPVILDDLLGTLPIMAADSLEHGSNSAQLALAWRGVASQIVESSPVILLDKAVDRIKR